MIQVVSRLDWWVGLFVGVCAFAMVGCGEDGGTSGTGQRGFGGGIVVAGSSSGRTAPVEGSEEGPPVRQYDESDFAEAESNRDPFRNFAALFQAQASQGASRLRNVVMPESSVEEMRLIAIVSGMSRPRAMLLDGDGVGHTVSPGDYLGRSEFVQVGGPDSEPLALTWRVSRIRSGELVITRPDPTVLNGEPIRRVILLREQRALN